MSVEIRILTVALLAVGLLGCGAHDGAHETGHGAAHGDRAPHAESGGSGLDHGLVLDGSRKWKMDDHTRATFGKMAQRMRDTDLETADTETLRARGGELKQDIGDLIAGCTMTGAAHDELHKFLTVYMPAVDRLAKSGDNAEATEVHELLETYARFFE